MIWLLLVSCWAPYTPEKVEKEEAKPEEERPDPIEDSALTLMGYQGQADISADWVGEETTVVGRQGNGDLLCAWQYETAGTSTTASPCVDPDGADCLFAFDVTLTDGREVDGDCGAFAQVGVEAGPYAYGYTEDYGAGGMSYGPALLFYYRYDAQWIAVSSDVTYDDAEAFLEYRWEVD